MRVRRGSEHRDGELAHSAAPDRQTIGERLGDVLRQHGVDAGERGDRCGDAGDSGVAATRERKPLDGALEQRVGRWRARRSFLPQPRSSRKNPGTSRTGPFAGRAGELLAPRPRHGQREVEAVEQRTRELLAVALDAVAPSKHTEPLGRLARRTGTCSSPR